MITNEQFLKEHFNEIFSDISVWKSNSYHYLLKIIDIKDDCVKIRLVVDNWPNETELSVDKKKKTILNVTADVVGDNFANFNFEYPKDIYFTDMAESFIIETLKDMLDTIKGKKEKIKTLFTLFYANAHSIGIRDEMLRLD